MSTTRVRTQVDNPCEFAQHSGRSGRRDKTSAIADLKEQLRHAQKLASLGTTVAMVAHEYNNILSPIVSYAQYALESEDVKMMRKTLKMVLQQHSAVAAMSNRILGYVRPGPTGVARVPLRQVVEDALVCLGRDPSKDNIRVTIDVDANLTVRGNANQLQQVFFNLLLNSRQAILGRPGAIRISATPISDTHCSVHVRDTGRGISREYLPHVFDPFFTTKTHEKKTDRRGIGLGLAICKDIIEEHGGLISVESIENSGTTFSITLPIDTPCDS